VTDVQFLDLLLAYNGSQLGKFCNPGDID
jgi:hypothetical protein